MQGVPGHFAVSGKVEFKALSRAKAFQKLQLAGAGAEVKQKASKVPWVTLGNEFSRFLSDHS